MTHHTARILLTGGCGYLGSALLHNSPEEPAIRVLDNMSSGDYRALCDLPEETQVEFIEADILDPLSVALALRGVETVIHLAAIVTTPVSFEHSRAMEQINHWGTVNLLNACVDAGVRHFVYASTSAVYGPGGPFDEDAPCRPVGSFASSLLNAETAVRAAARRGIATTILRLGMVYGEAPVMRFNNVVNRHALMAGTGRALSIFGDGTQRRPIVHTRDACAAIRHCLARPMDPTGSVTLNVHSQVASVLDVATELQALRPHTKLRSTEQDVLTHLSFDADNRRLLDGGWAPRVTLREGLDEMLARFGHVAPPAALGSAGA